MHENGIVEKGQGYGSIIWGTLDVCFKKYINLENGLSPGKKMDCILQPELYQGNFNMPSKNGVYLRYIRRLSGHKSSKIMEVYVHGSKKDLSKIKSLLDLIIEKSS